MFERISGLNRNDSVLKVGGTISRSKYFRNAFILTLIPTTMRIILSTLEKKSVDESGQEFPISIWILFIVFIAPMVYLFYQNIFKRYQDIKAEVMTTPMKLAIVVMFSIPFLNAVLGLILLFTPSGNLNQTQEELNSNLEKLNESPIETTTINLNEISEEKKIENKLILVENEKKEKVTSSKIEEVNKLISLKESGHLTEEEFKELKGEIFKKAS